MDDNVQLKVVIYGQGGRPLPNATVVISLSHYDADTADKHYVIPSEDKYKTDGNGEVVIPFWKNSSGQRSSRYTLKVMDSYGWDSQMVVTFSIPDDAVDGDNLMDFVEMETFTPGSDIGIALDVVKVVQESVKRDRVLSERASTRAKRHEDVARGSASAARDSADAAQLVYNAIRDYAIPEVTAADIESATTKKGIISVHDVIEAVKRHINIHMLTSDIHRSAVVVVTTADNETIEVPPSISVEVFIKVAGNLLPQPQHEVDKDSDGKVTGVRVIGSSAGDEFYVTINQLPEDVVVPEPDFIRFYAMVYAPYFVQPLDLDTSTEFVVSYTANDTNTAIGLNVRSVDDSYFNISLDMLPNGRKIIINLMDPLQPGSPAPLFIAIEPSELGGSMTIRSSSNLALPVPTDGLLQVERSSGEIYLNGAGFSRTLVASAVTQDLLIAVGEEENF